MTKHSKSLLLSILIHSLLLGFVFYAYSEVSSFLGHKKEKKVCIKLGCIHSVATETNKSPIKEKKSVEKVKKRAPKTPPKKPHKKIVKKRVKTKTVPKKVIPVKKIQKLPEPKSQEIVKVEEKEPKKEQIIVAEDECPAQQIKPQKKRKDAQEQTLQTESSSQRYINTHLAEIAQLLQENLYYPRRARKRGIEGEVIVKFTLKTDAEVAKIEIISSENEILSRGAIRTLEDLSGAFPKPDEQLTLRVPISYSLQK
jgi:protein TonB